MDTKGIDWSALDALDQVIQEFVTPTLYPQVRQPLQSIANETERIVACLSRIDELLAALRLERSRLHLPEPWLPNPDRQIVTLEEGYNDLIEVATVILPNRAMNVLKKRMH